MELLALALVWPLLLLVLGFVLITSADASGYLVAPFFLLFLIFIFGLGGRLGEAGATNEFKQLDRVRRGTASLSIALLLPIFAKYLLAASDRNLPTMILALIFGFGVLVWGMFVKNKVLMYANIVGGAFVIIYLYFQIWSLGQLAQIVATAFGLVVAVVVSVVRFREKLV